MFIGSRSQGFFVAQQNALGAERPRRGDVRRAAVVKAFGREADSSATFDELNTRYYDAGLRAQFVSGVILPMMNCMRFRTSISTAKSSWREHGQSMFSEAGDEPRRPYSNPTQRAP